MLTEDAYQKKPGLCNCTIEIWGFNNRIYGTLKFEALKQCFINDIDNNFIIINTRSVRTHIFKRNKKYFKYQLNASISQKQMSRTNFSGACTTNATAVIYNSFSNRHITKIHVRVIPFKTRSVNFCHR